MANDNSELTKPPGSTQDEQLLESPRPDEFTHTDTWRVFRIMGEFVVGFDELQASILQNRADPAMRPALAADPRVLALIARVVQAAAATGVDVSVCGDAAADPAVLPLLIGLGVRKLSVGAARVRQVAEWITAADSTVCAALACQALQAAGPEQAQVRVETP